MSVTVTQPNAAETPAAKFADPKPKADLTPLDNGTRAKCQCPFQVWIYILIQFKCHLNFKIFVWIKCKPALKVLN